ncbi:MAG: PepSY-associated TM helix domain-containing protein [Terriglobia bacterium]
MDRTFYIWTRDLHIYIGLALSPLVLLFAISVILLDHPSIPLGGARGIRKTSVTVQIPENLEHVEGMARAQEFQQIMRQMGVAGEIGYINYNPSQHRMVAPVFKPGSEVTLDVNLSTHIASLEERKTGILAALIYLHKSPGPHNANIRGNWFYTRAWRWLADASAYLILFTSASGIYLWWAIKTERKIGLVLLGAGALSFMGVIYVIAL